MKCKHDYYCVDGFGSRDIAAIVLNRILKKTDIDYDTILKELHLYYVPYVLSIDRCLECGKERNGLEIYLDKNYIGLKLTIEKKKIKLTQKRAAELIYNSEKESIKKWEEDFKTAMDEL